MPSCTPEKPEPAPEPVTLNVFMTRNDAGMDDAPLVVEALNEYIKPLIGARVEITFVDSSYVQTISQKFVSDEPMDILYCPRFQALTDWAEQGQIMPLDGLLEAYGQGIYGALDREYIEVSKISGAIYGLPVNREMAVNLGLEYRADIAQKYGIDMSGVKTIDDLDGVFRQVKEKCPGVTPVAVVRHRSWDALGNPYGVLMDMGQGTRVENLYETEEFERQVRRVYDWRRKGYVLDTVSDAGENFYYFRSGEVFSSVANGKPGFTTQETRTVGHEMGFVELIPAFSCTSDVKWIYYAIAKSSANPQKAMEFLNLMYTDPVVENLLIYGIEGKHYVFADKDKDIITFPEGVTADNSGYAQFSGWRHCNQFIAHVWEGDPPDIWEQVRALNKTAPRSKAFGFVFEPDNVQAEIIRCNEVCDKYLSGLQNGFLNPDETLEEFRAALRDAGIDSIIAEKQAQLDAWLKTGELH